MSGKDRQVKSIVLYEGHVRWIMERETPEERLAAWETLAAIAFPENPYELPYKPPQVPLDGSVLSRCDRVRRDTYNMLADFINSRVWEVGGSGKNPKKVLAGKLGAAIRHGKYGSSSSTAYDYDSTTPSDSCEDIVKPAPPQSTPMQESYRPHITMTPLDERVEETEYFSERYRKIEPTLSARDKTKIAELNKKFPNAAALREWLDRNYFQGNKLLVCSEQFCAYAFQRLAKDANWISYRTNHVINNLLTVIHWMAIDFQRKSNEIRRAEEEEDRKNKESEFESRVQAVSQMSNEDIADKERISARRAERRAMEKILRGEL